MSNWLGLLVSTIYVALVVGISSLCYKKKKFTEEESRKFIHIGVCNWWLLAWIFFDNYIIASILPAIMVVLNYYNFRFGFIPGMEPKEKKKRSMGTVWYALSVFILTILLFQQKENLYIGALAILILGYGDGLAGLLGSAFGKHKIEVGNKSMEGSLVVLLLSFLISIILLQALFPAEQVAIYSLYIAVFATMVEAFSPKGSDNLFLPLGVALFTYLLVTYQWFMPIATAFTVTSAIVFMILVKKSLTPLAAFSSLILGTAIYVLAGPVPFGALILFFLTSTMIEHYHKKSLKEKQRNLNQVEENGLAALLFSIMYAFTGSEIALIAIFVSIAGATADTWSSGIGYYSKERVKSIITGKPLPKGESGGVTKLGTLGAVLGALLIALFSLLAPGEHILTRFLLVFGFGFFTSILDSIFGVFLQVKYYDKEKGIILEKKPKNMKGIEKVSGYHFLTNGMVNFVTIMISCILCCLLSIIIF